MPIGVNDVFLRQNPIGDHEVLDDGVDAAHVRVRAIAKMGGAAPTGVANSLTHRRRHSWP
jgi:hypothetical protein